MRLANNPGADCTAKNGTAVINANRNDRTIHATITVNPTLNANRGNVGITHAPPICIDWRLSRNPNTRSGAARIIAANINPNKMRIAALSLTNIATITTHPLEPTQPPIPATA